MKMIIERNNKTRQSKLKIKQTVKYKILLFYKLKIKNLKIN